MEELNAEETKKHVDNSATSQIGEKEYVGQIYGVIGIIVVNQIEYVVVINEIALVGSVHNMKKEAGIHLIKNVMLFPV